MIHLPDVPPSVCSVLLLIALLPAMISAWRAATNMLQGKFAADQAASFFVHAVVFSAFSGFMLSFHCHEKAMLTVSSPFLCLFACFWVTPNGTCIMAAATYLPQELVLTLQLAHHVLSTSI